MTIHKLSEVEIRYNQFVPITEIFINGKAINQSSKLYKYNGENINKWIFEIIGLLIEEINDDEFKLIFVGDKKYFEDIKAECKKHEGIILIHKEESKKISTNINDETIENKDLDIEKNEDIRDENIEKIDNRTRIDKLTELVDYMQNGPIEELRSEAIKRDYERAINSEFEIAVVATMSSGKSTLINAILGKDIIPAKNEACTAKISKIRNVNGKKEFSVVAYDKNNNVIEKYDIATAEVLQSINNNEKVGFSYIEGDIPSINADSMNLVLIDTPGPNNSQDESHREKTMEVIKNDEYKPLVLYIMNATQLGVDDDNTLLNIIRDEIDIKDKQSKDRFIFVLNKIDCIDPEKESIEKIINNAKKYLESNGIKNPNIYPASSSTAKNIRNYFNGQELTRKEERDLFSNAEGFNESKDLHLLKYTPLNESIKKSLQQDIEKFKEMNSDEGDLLQALYHSGVPYIEAAINEYLEKYAITFKIQEAIDSFKRRIDKQNIEQGILKELEDSNRIIENTNSKIKNKKSHIDKHRKNINENQNELNSTKDLINKNNKELHKKHEDLKIRLKEISNLENDTQSASQQVCDLYNTIQSKKREAEAIKNIIDNRNSDKFKKKVEELKVDTYIEARNTKGKIHSSIIKIGDELKNKKQVSRYEAEQILNKLNKQIALLGSDIKTDLDRLVQKNIKDVVMQLMQEYRREIRGLFEDNKEINMDSSSVKFIMASMPSAKEISNQYSYEKDVVVGTKTVTNYDKKWYKPWTWKQSKTYEENIYEKKEFVDLSEIQNKYIIEIKRNLEKNVDDTMNYIQEQIEGIKLDFNMRVDRFDEVLKQEIDKYNNLIEEAEKREQDRKIEEERVEKLKKIKEELKNEKERLENESKTIEYNNKNLSKTEKEIKERNAKIQRNIEEKEKELTNLNKEFEKAKINKLKVEEKERFLNDLNRKLKEIIV